MILSKKGQIVEFIKKNKKSRRMDLYKEFGFGGYTNSLIQTLLKDKVIQEKPFECGTCVYLEVRK